MRFTISAALLAFAATAFAQTDGFDAMTAPLKDEEVPAGTTYSIKWQPTDAYDGSTVTLSLLGGDTASTLLDLGAFAEGVDNSAGVYEWPVASSLGSAVTYGIKITLDSNTAIFQYSFPFHITSSGSAEISSSSSSSSSLSAAGYPTSGSYSSSAAATYPVTTASSAPVSTAVVISTTSTSSSYSTFATVTASGSAGNSSATYSASASASTTLSTANHSASSSASSTPTVVTTNGAPRAAAGSLALIGLVAAAFAL
ncbi:hypothetical protein SUNI508_05180 [Seiridium unicorne]|uniref:Yeast cell wall synthesis Kre9/Knh1-like N-terminal domain-containing protein n=1 Tax=Seiridium unicorne TaxID=138068 RepID=A0ABR2V4N5_9PEZI